VLRTVAKPCGAALVEVTVTARCYASCRLYLRAENSAQQCIVLASAYHGETPSASPTQVAARGQLTCWCEPAHRRARQRLPMLMTIDRPTLPRKPSALIVPSQVVGSRTTADIQWQDGSVQRNASARNFVPVSFHDEHDFAVGFLVLCDLLLLEPETIRLV